MKTKFWQNSLPSIAAGCFVLSSSNMALAQNGETTTTTTKSTGPAQVVNSYMVPTMMQTKETTNKDGDTIRETAPMIQERHEQVLVPQEETMTSTTVNKPAPVVTEEKQISRSSTVAAVRKPCVHKRVAYRPHVKKVASASSYVRTQKVVQQPTVAHTEQTVIDKSMIYERKDPALDAQ